MPMYFKIYRSSPLVTNPPHANSKPLENPLICWIYNAVTFEPAEMCEMCDVWDLWDEKRYEFARNCCAKF